MAKPCHNNPQIIYTLRPDGNDRKHFRYEWANRTYTTRKLWLSEESDTTAGKTQIVELDRTEMVIWPNPTTGKLNIVTDQNAPDLEDSFIDVIDLRGRSVYRTALTDQKTELDSGGLESGTYLIRFKSANKMLYRRIQKL